MKKKMERSELLALIERYPHRTISSIEMDQANVSIKIYEGPYQVIIGGTMINLTGSIFFDWFPQTCAKFIGIPKDNFKDKFENFLNINAVSLLIEGLYLGEGYLSKIDYTDFQSIKQVKGIINNPVVLGDKSIPVEKLLFSVPNLRDFYGSPVKSIGADKINVSMSRITLESEKYLITLDKSVDYKKIKDDLELKGGYILQYRGELRNKKGKILYEESRDIILCLNSFLSFINGRHTSALFLEGTYENKTVWTDFSSYINDPYIDVYTWPEYNSFISLGNVWRKFSILWEDDNSRNSLKSTIHWYVEANCNSGLVEGSIIMAQTALELIYNWWIIEDKKLIAGKDAEGISAANKIRLLLFQLNIGYSVPEAFTNLKNIVVNSTDIIDGPDAIVQIRNAIVHSQEEKRKKIINISNKARDEAKNLSLWYIELALLKILGYEGKYRNRTSKGIFPGQVEEDVPWTRRQEG